MGNFLKWLIWRIWYEVAYYPFFIIAMIFALLWLGEGVAEQSGWISCPRP